MHREHPRPKRYGNPPRELAIFAGFLVLFCAGVAVAYLAAGA